MSKVIALEKKYHRITFTDFTEGRHERLTEFLKTYEDKIVYLVAGNETCPSTGKQHLQGFIHINSKWLGKTWITRLRGAHLENALGSDKDSEVYCKKENDIFIEHGTPSPGQGARVDLKKIKDEILSGNLTTIKIREEMPEIYHQYGKTLDKIEDDRLSKLWRSEMTKGIWLWGRTGVGKSRLAFNGFDPNTHYSHETRDKGWWDNYKGQETVILNDFRGAIPYEEILQLCDRHPCGVPRRGRPPHPFLAKTLIITSSVPPQEVFRKRNKVDRIDQLFRRFEVFRVEIADEKKIELYPHLRDSGSGQVILSLTTPSGRESDPQGTGIFIAPQDIIEDEESLLGIPEDRKRKIEEDDKNRINDVFKILKVN